jgi:RHS repeat-associated protein
VGITISAVSNTSWGETSITWNNKPAVGAALASGTVTNKTFAWYEFDVTGYLAAERAAGRNVVTLALRAPAASSLTVNANSRQAATNKPQLVFTLNAAPTVSLTSPTDGASYAAGASITLTATAADGDGTITQVEFFAGANLIGTVTQSPYTFAWTNVSVGSYALIAKATDNLGTATTSSQVNIIVTAAPALYFIHPDYLNTPRVITNQAQQVVWRWDNDDPFGGNMANENPSGLGNFTCNLRFPGQYFDQETNLHYNHYRDYSPEIGRYIESDPIGLVAGTNTYAYANGAPDRFVDPLGLEILLESHPVALGLDHSKITIIPRNQTLWANDPRFVHTLPDGRQYATLGAGPEGGHLISNLNRPRDLVRSHNKSSQQCTHPDITKPEDQLIRDLLHADSRYRDRLDYEYFPVSFTDGFNSNSYISGLLNATGLYIQGVHAPPTTPGFEKPVPVFHFGR